MQQIAEELDLWGEVWKDDHKTKIERLNLDCFTAEEKCKIRLKAARLERFKIQLGIDYLSFRVVKSGNRVALQAILQAEV